MPASEKARNVGRTMARAVPVQRVISAAGFVTSLGGGALPEAVRAAIAEATAATWRPDNSRMGRAEPSGCFKRAASLQASA